MAETTIRSFRPGDEPAILSLWNTALARDTISPAVFAAKVLLDANFHHDGLAVAEQDGRITGFMLALARRYPLYAAGLDEGRGWMTAFAVAGDCRRQGTGSRLLEHCLAYLRQHGARTVWVSPYAPHYFTPGVDSDAYPAARSFLAGRGFTLAYRAHSMARDLLDFVAPPEAQEAAGRLAQEGMSVGPLAAHDIYPLCRFVEEHFPGDWERFIRDALAQVTASRAERERIWVARQGDEIIGYCQYDGERFGPFGVRSAERGRGIGLALLSHCLAAMKAAGHHNAWFLWGGERNAHLYRRVGFAETRYYEVMKRDV